MADSNSKKNVRKRTVSNKKNDLDVLKRNAGVMLVIVSCACFIALIFCGSFWSNNLNMNILNAYNSNEIKTSNKNYNEIKKEINSVNADKVFNEMYEKALEKSADFAYGTNWIKTCSNSQTKINDVLYVKICDDRFETINDIVNYYSDVFSNEFILKALKDEYYEYNNELYVKPFNVQKDDTYLGINSYRILYKTNNKISYLVKSEYKMSNNNIAFQEHKFEIKKNGDIWQVVTFEYPF